ncbi:MAG TPA: hypothetical protein VNY05_16780 [Candidatus Acidoferrales bacterium]|jgi:hypothetical protein|nr:hypothetical protein [Candidatus Acidoferrales bacterium]
MALLNNFADRDPAKFLSGMDPRNAGALLVGQITNLRQIVNPPARCGSEPACVGGLAREMRQADCHGSAQGTRDSSVET